MRWNTISRQASFAAFAVALGLLIPTWGHAGTFVAFGPDNYVRGTGTPVTVTKTFTVLNPNTTYTIKINNGGLTDGEFEAVSSSVFFLNGVQIVGPNEFNQKVTIIEKPVTLASTNTLSVEVRGKPGGGLTVQIIGVDDDPPTIIAAATPSPNAAGWNNSDVTVTFSCSDQTSGIATCPEPVIAMSEGGNQLISGTAVDRAGNIAQASVTIHLDKTPPVISTGVDPPPNGAGWHRTDPTVTFSAVDALSGVASVSPPATVTTEGANQSIVGSATDRAGNAASITALVNLDKTPPAIAATLSPQPNAAGWTHSDTTVTFNATDGISGIASATPPTVVTTEGANQSISGTATDVAGNSAAASATVSLDKTPPEFLITSPGQGTNVYTPALIIKGTVTDTLSGVAGVFCDGAPATLLGTQVECTVTLTPGANAINGTATDVAGNSSSAALALNNVPVPKLTITSPAHLGYLNISPTTVTGTVDDPTATIMINSIPATNANGHFTVAIPLAEGPNIIAATATTSVAVGTASIEVTLDTTPPHVTITSPPEGFVTTESMISVAGNVNDLVVGTVNEQQAQVTVNGAGAQVANRMFLASNVSLALGPNVIQAVGVDRVGNAATTQITVVRQAPPAQPKIQLVSGNNQVGPIGSLLPAPLVVALSDAAGHPVPNTPVIFKVTQNDGAVTGGGTSGPTAMVTTDAQGQARAQWTLGMRAGAGGDSVEAYAVGFAGTAIFTATGTLGQSAKIVVDTGNDQIGPIGQPLPKPFIAVVVDNGNNRVAGVPVTFTVKQGGGAFAGQPSITMNTDSDGRVAATLTLGLQEGNANNLVEANFPNNQGFPAGFTASGRAPGDPAQTRISGVVLDNSDTPIPGVTMRAVSTNVLNANPNAVQTIIAVRTDAQGQFTLPHVPVGFVKLLADGSTAERPGTYPALEYDLITVAGQNNTVSQPIYLLPLNPANQLCVTATSGGGTLTIPEAPGFSLTFGPGQVTFPGGSKTGCVSVTVVHGDKVPMAPGFGQQPRFIVTIQPAGAVFNPPAPITLPNVDGLKPRAVTEMYSFDHDIGSFVAIGTGVVSDDGLVIRSSPGVGVLKAGWHCGGDPNTTGSAATCPECQRCQTNQCVADINQLSCSDDGKFCTDDRCSGGHCEHPPKPTGTICNDNLFCTENDQCQSDQCEGTPMQDRDLSEVTFGLSQPKFGLDGLEVALNLFKFLGIDIGVDFSANIVQKTISHCCEQQKDRSTNLQNNVGFSFGVQGGPIPIPGLAVICCHVPLLGRIDLLTLGVFIEGAGQLGGSIVETMDECLNKKIWAGTVTDSFSGILEAIGKVVGSMVLKFKAGGTTGITGTGTLSTDGVLTLSADWDGITLFIDVTLISLVEFQATEQVYPAVKGWKTVSIQLGDLF